MVDSEKVVAVLSYLLPKGGWTIIGDDFNSITYDEGVTPITKKQWDDAFKIVDELKIQKEEEAKKAKKTAESKLMALGLTLEDLKSLGLSQ